MEDLLAVFFKETKIWALNLVYRGHFFLSFFLLFFLLFLKSRINVIICTQV